jgi:hypothetical protein
MKFEGNPLSRVICEKKISCGIFFMGRFEGDVTDDPNQKNSAHMINKNLNPGRLTMV